MIGDNWIYSLTISIFVYPLIEGLNEIGIGAGVGIGSILVILVLIVG